MFKGPDYTRARIVVDGQTVLAPINEFDDYWLGRYLTATEAAYRIFGYHITSKYPSVTSLPVHTQISIRHSQFTRHSGPSSNMSLLRRYFYRPIGTFILNGIERNFNDITYMEYYRIFRLSKWQGQSFIDQVTKFEEHNLPSGEPQQMIILRSHQNTHLTRIASAKPSEGERFYIRALLQRRPVRSFEELRTIDGKLYPLFQHAAIALGLFVSHKEAEFAIAEAIASLYTPFQLRRLFIDILVNECTDTPILLWELYSDNFQMDFKIHLGSDEQALELCLRELSSMLEEHGKCLNNYGLPMPNSASDRSEVDHELANQRLNLRRIADNAYQTFNYDQITIFDRIINAVDTYSSLLLFIDGKAGRGKTYLLNAVCDKLHSSGIIVLPTAISAFAAQLYKGGRTTHSTFKVHFLLKLINQFILTFFIL
jgi:hypothetical protein